MRKRDKARTMNGFKLIYSLICLLPMLLFWCVGCTSGGEGLPSDDMETDILINWSVEFDTISQSRALVDNTILQTACSPSEDGFEAIGIWGKYDVNEDGTTSTYELFDNVPLTFAAKGDYTNPYNNWNYPGKSPYWRLGAEYSFRACFPQSLMNDLMTEMSATVFQGTINTSTLQEDILVAATKVNTKTDDFTGPVRLCLQHIFAAIQFKVKSAEGFNPADGEGVTSCWLQNNSNATDLFSASGYLVHSGDAAPEIIWHPHASSATPMYVWKHQGMSFKTENTLYTPDGTLDGEEYTHNDGWLLVVPQTVKDETLQFCYTLKHAGEQVFSVNIPSVTYGYGKRYTYVLEIRGSEADVSLTIKSWNHLDSNYEIIM